MLVYTAAMARKSPVSRSFFYFIFFFMIIAALINPHIQSPTDRRDPPLRIPGWQHWSTPYRSEEPRRTFRASPPPLPQFPKKYAWELVSAPVLACAFQIFLCEVLQLGMNALLLTIVIPHYCRPPIANEANSKYPTQYVTTRQPSRV